MGEDAEGLRYQYDYQLFRRRASERRFDEYSDCDWD